MTHKMTVLAPFQKRSLMTPTTVLASIHTQSCRS